jgi:hypothetical protein
MYPARQKNNKIKITILDLIDDLFNFVLNCVSSLKSFKSLSYFLEKNLHF